MSQKLSNELNWAISQIINDDPTNKEKYIRRKNSEYIFLYCYLYKTELTDSEQFLLDSDLYSILYSLIITRKQLPDKAHNRILLKSLKTDSTPPLYKMYLNSLKHKHINYSLNLTSINYTYYDDRTPEYSIYYSLYQHDYTDFCPVYECLTFNFEMLLPIYLD
jgi:hypothetical protein